LQDTGKYYPSNLIIIRKSFSMVEKEITSSQSRNSTTVNGIEISYLDQGDGDPLVLLHGGTGTATAHWEPYFPLFSEEFRVIAPDLRGHGRTNNPEMKWSYRMMADDLAALIRDLGLQKPAICGWSDGAQIALELAIRYPGLTNGYLVGGVMVDFSEAYLKMLKDWGFEGPGEVNIPRLQEVTPDYVEYIKSLHSPQGTDYWKELLTGISKMWHTPLDYTNEDLLKISEPMLIVTGDRDQFIPIEDTVSMYRRIPNAELAVVPNADHALPRTEIDVFADIVVGYLMRIQSMSS
jgi:pimeloyl-ACP methyl ester carboxylesterase